MQQVICRRNARLQPSGWFSGENLTSETEGKNSVILPQLCDGCGAVLRECRVTLCRTIARYSCDATPTSRIAPGWPGAVGKRGDTLPGVAELQLYAGVRRARRSGLKASPRYSGLSAAMPVRWFKDSSTKSIVCDASASCNPSLAEPRLHLPRQLAANSHGGSKQRDGAADIQGWANTFGGSGEAGVSFQSS